MRDQELDQPATRRDVLALEEKLRSHFDVVAESFRADFANLFDWTKVTTSAIGERLDGLEHNDANRLTSVESRVTRLERRRKSSS
jgi:hypothetical protein